MSALRTKRAQSDSELHEAEREAAKQRVDLDATDRAIRVFEPEATPQKIKRPNRQSTRLPAREFGRSILDILRRQEAPMTARVIAEALAEKYRLDVLPGPGMHRLSR